VWYASIHTGVVQNAMLIALQAILVGGALWLWSRGQASAAIESLVPKLLTPGAAESIAVKLYRSVRTEGLSPIDALRDTLDQYQPPVPPDVMDFQISLAAREASDGEFVPEMFRHLR